jgi:hypothetical protein
MTAEPNVGEIADQLPGAVPGEDGSTLALPCTKHPGKGLCVQLRLPESKPPSAR